VFVVVNAKSGNTSPDQVRAAWRAHFARSDAQYQIHEPAEGEDILESVRKAASEGYDTVVAAGGDGTVSAVANGVIGGSARLGIILLGTANVLARELHIPLALGDACALLSGPNQTRTIDAMKVKNSHYFTQIGIGVDAAMIRDTNRERKRWLGNAAYVWTAVKRFIGFQTHRFSIAADDRRARPRALQVVVANSGCLRTSGLCWGPGTAVDDGQIDVCIVRVQNLISFLSVVWSVLRGKHREDRNIQLLTARRAVAVHTDRPLPVQGDGEVIGQTPLEIHLAPAALRVVVPLS
jgi:YegS/Rv2252/BmrU family lipid kinase